MRSRSAKGSIYVELVLVLPVLFIVGFACLEISNALRTKQALVMLSRDMGSIALRRCGDLDDATDIRDCLRDVHAEFNARAKSQLELKDQDLNGDLGLVLGIYKYNNACTTPPAGCSQLRNYFPPNQSVNINGTLVPSGGFPANFNDSQFFASGGKYNDLLLKSRLLVTAEVYLAYDPLIGSKFTSFSGNSPGGKRIFYEVALF